MIKLLRCFAFVLSLSLFIGSCSDGLFDELATNNVVPTVSSPYVRSYEIENGIVIYWDSDDGADEYLIYRDTVPTGSFSENVYQGNDLSYVDYGVYDNTVYYYKLAKRREKKIFDKSDYSLGKTSSTRRDKYENNNSVEYAAKLDNITNANIYYHIDGFGNEILDRDWYYVSLSPRTRTRLVIDNLDDGESEIGEDEVCFNIKGDVLKAIYNGVEFWLENYEFSSEIRYFQISVNTEGSFGNKIMSYRIRITEISNIL